MRFRTVVKIGVGLSVLLFCIGVAFYSFLSLTDVEKGKDVNMFALVPDDCNGVLDTDNIFFYTSEFPRTSYAIDLDTLHHSELINNILTDISKYTSVNTHGLSNQIKRLMISFHNSTSTKDVIAYFKIAGGGNKFLLDILRQKYGQDIYPKTEEYRGKKIEIYPLGKTANFLSVLSGDGYIIVSYHKMLIERVIDAIKDGTSLANDAVFKNYQMKKSANYMTFYGRTASFPLLADNNNVWSEFELHLNSDVLYLSGSMYEPDSCSHDIALRLDNIHNISSDSILIVSGHEKVDSCITNAISKPKNRIFDQCLSNLSRDASYIMVADMDKVAENIEQYSPYIPGFICDNIGLFRSFIISSQVTEINGRYSHIYVFTYKD